MATITTNTDIDYVQKDYNSSVDAIISFANINFGPGTSANRLWTNFNIDSFSRNWLEIVAFISDVFFFYFDNQATQSYLQTATIRSAVKDIANQFGFTPASATSSSGTATFTVTGAGTIPRGYRLRASNGEEFFVTNDIISIAAGDVSGTVLQGIILTEQFNAEGVQNEEFDLTGPNVIRDLQNLNPQDISPQLTVAGNDYTLVTSFIRHNGADSDAIIDSLGNIIGGGGRVYTVGERPNGTPFIRFGDGIFGRKLNAGELVTVTYRTGGGSAGNIGKQTLTTSISTNPIVSSVTNNSEFSGGSDEQSIDQLRELIPASLRTLERAVSQQDYSDLLVASFNEVFAASTEPNQEDPGIDINIYVVPQGSGIVKISDNAILKNKLSNFIDRRKMITTQFQILDAFGVDTLISLEIFIGDTISKNTTKQSIITALQNFFNLSTGGSDGSGVGFAENILLKDIDNLVESIAGIERFEIKRLTYRPRIQQNIIGLLTEYTNSSVTIFPNVTESEWLLAAAGPVNETAGTTIFSNTGLIGFTYNSSTGDLTYSFPVNLDGVSPGDTFQDGALVGFTIQAVDTINSKLVLPTGQTVNNTVTLAIHGAILNGATAFESFKCFKKILAKATNLSIDSITDNNLDLSVKNGTGSAISARILLDNLNVFIPGEFSTGQFYLVDSAGNIWEIVSNDSNTLTTSITAVNDGGITNVASGDYSIVQKLVGKQVLFNGNIFNIQFNGVNTVFSIGAQFSQIGTIGDKFAISFLQTNLGNLGVNLDLISFNNSTGEIRLNSSPNLQGINSNNILMDSTGQIFNIVGVDNRAKPSVIYDSSNQNTSFILQGVGEGVQIAQGFKVTSTDTYAVVSFNLKRNGNIVGNLTAKIVNDAAGLPDLSSPVATSQSINVTSISDAAFEKVVFNFTTPPTLNSGTQYHLVLTSDPAYQAAEQSGIVTFDNTGLVAFSYNSVSGAILYSSSVNLASVVPGNYFKDTSGNLFKILAVDDTSDTIILDSGLTVNVTAPTLSSHGSVIANDRILVGIDTTSPTYSDGEFSRYDGSLWSNSTLGPDNNFTDTDGNVYSATSTDCIFSIEGTKTITIKSNLTPVMGSGATASSRYYDDNNEVSFILGISNGSITSASDANALGKGTVATVPNRSVDSFVFRTSRYTDDIVNLRLNEIPQIKASDIITQVFGGVE